MIIYFNLKNVDRHTSVSFIITAIKLITHIELSQQNKNVIFVFLFSQAFALYKTAAVFLIWKTKWHNRIV